MNEKRKNSNGVAVKSLASNNPILNLVDGKQ